jgi:hypothetical protein
MPVLAKIVDDVQIAAQTNETTQQTTGFERFTQLSLAYGLVMNNTTAPIDTGRANSTVLPGTERTEGMWDGKVSYAEKQRLLRMLWGAPTKTELVASQAYQYVFDVPFRGELTPVFYTGEIGAGSNGEVCAGMFGTGYTLNVSPSDSRHSMPVIAKPALTGQTITSGGTVIDDTIANPRKWGLYGDATHTAAFGATPTLFDEAFDIALTISGIRNVYETVDPTLTSYKGSVSQSGGTAQLRFSLPVGALANTLIARGRAGDPTFFRLKNEGATLSGAHKWLDQTDMCGKLLSIERYGNTQGVKSLPFTFDLVPSVAWGKWLVFTQKLKENIA